jgi:hypothetical protein
MQWCNVYMCMLPLTRIQSTHNEQCKSNMSHGLQLQGRGNETMVGWQTMDTGESWLDDLNWMSVMGQHALHEVLSPSIILICQIQEKCFVYAY